jgi:hypothetical protein
MYVALIAKTAASPPSQYADDRIARSGGFKTLENIPSNSGSVCR